jgi:predicted N-acetyltransferase YhbS
MLPRVEVRNAGPRALEFLCGLWHATWYSSHPAEAHYRYRMRLLTSPWARRHLQVLVLEESGHPRSGMIVLDLPVRLGGRRLRTAGIAAIVTDPDHRGRGLAARLLAIAHRRLSDAGKEASLLFSDIGTTYYQRFGYVAWPVTQYTLALDVPGRGRSRSRGRARAPAIEPARARDLPEQARLYREHQASFPLALERSTLYWRHLLMRARLRDRYLPEPAPDPDGARRPAPDRWIARRSGGGGRALACARCLVRDEDVLVTEAAFSTGQAAALRALLLDRAATARRPAISITAPRSLVEALELPVASTRSIDKMMLATLGRPGEAGPSPVEHCLWPEDWF